MVLPQQDQIDNLLNIFDVDTKYGVSFNLYNIFNTIISDKYAFSLYFTYLPTGWKWTLLKAEAIFRS